MQFSPCITQLNMTFILPSNAKMLPIGMYPKDKYNAKVLKAGKTIMQFSILAIRNS